MGEGRRRGKGEGGKEREGRKVGEERRNRKTGLKLICMV